MQETTYEHMADEKTFTVTAAERWSISMINKLKEKYPDQVEIAYVNEDGSILARVPYEWMRIKPKTKRNLTDEQRIALRDRMLKLKSDK